MVRLSPELLSYVPCSKIQVAAPKVGISWILLILLQRSLYTHWLRYHQWSPWTNNLPYLYESWSFSFFQFGCFSSTCFLCITLWGSSCITSDMSRTKKLATCWLGIWHPVGTAASCQLGASNQGPPGTSNCRCPGKDWASLVVAGLAQEILYVTTAAQLVRLACNGQGCYLHVFSMLFAGGSVGWGKRCLTFRSKIIFAWRHVLEAGDRRDCWCLWIHCSLYPWGSNFRKSTIWKKNMQFCCYFCLTWRFCSFIMIASLNFWWRNSCWLNKVLCLLTSNVVC